MKILIAITSCGLFEENGINQACRDTFLQDVKKFPDLTYRFFIGKGDPADNHLMRYLEGISHPSQNTTFDTCSKFTLKEDTILLPVPDDYKHVAFKTQEKLKWALNNGFDYIFLCFADTYINIKRLINSDFINQDYIGSFFKWDKSWSPVETEGCSGGAGYWVSKKAAKLIIDTPVTDWADDRWIATIMKKNNIMAIYHQGYVEYPKYPTKNNNYITSHLFRNTIKYNTDVYYEIRKNQYEN
jgi:hypothetical protein